MKASYPLPAAKIADFVEDILVIENYNVKSSFVLPLFANGKPTLLFQTAKGKIKNNSNYLTLFGQTIFPEQITLTENFTLIAYFFKPFALTALFGFSAQELTNNPISLNLLQQQTTKNLQEQLLNASSNKEMLNLLDDFIFSLITKVKTDTKLIQYATQLISENPAKEILTKVRDELCVTERTFQRMFEQKVGLSPNQYRRVAQFNAAFQQLNKRQFKLITDIAFTHNYADQSHFIRAFKEFTNLTPKEYLRF
ncbi:AraC family transcriptional regulator [Adhaeribacter radiodurans]|uniref:Helix-turn-helix domain-containing protein n=1 Tax=Adhaeribacter radiodurans TaxID=2745197 RepID=A0A7L7LB05_9BACT|nr:AraC family transcriptional regulator [Adhaeribacter radiodurans]QMU29917.1 helix-turn-helix domain-containing protein [Adhaeribacter radiodurans]